MYARHKGLALEDVTVRVEHSKIHATDCENCETRDGKIDRFERRITLEGDLDDASRQRLLEIADRCPVHRTLKSETHIVTALAD
jgi:putative redox protein